MSAWACSGEETSLKFHGYAVEKSKSGKAAEKAARSPGKCCAGAKSDIDSSIGLEDGGAYMCGLLNEDGTD